VGSAHTSCSQICNVLGCRIRAVNKASSLKTVVFVVLYSLSFSIQSSSSLSCFILLSFLLHVICVCFCVFFVLSLFYLFLSNHLLPFLVLFFSPSHSTLFACVSAHSLSYPYFIFFFIT